MRANHRPEASRCTSLGKIYQERQQDHQAADERPWKALHCHEIAMRELGIEHCSCPPLSPATRCIMHFSLEFDCKQALPFPDTSILRLKDAQRRSWRYYAPPVFPCSFLLRRAKTKRGAGQNACLGIANGMGLVIEYTPSMKFRPSPKRARPAATSQHHILSSIGAAIYDST
jgi:hypothetical protein